MEAFLPHRSGAVTRRAAAQRRNREAVWRRRADVAEWSEWLEVSL